MKRKIVQQGPSTLMVSLPSKWVKHHKLKKGQELDIEEHEGKLTVHAGKPQDEQKEIVVSLKNEQWRHTRSLIGGLYKKGYDRIILHYPKESIYKIIEDSTNSLIGYEIFEKHKGKCIIQSMVIEDRNEYTHTINKMLHAIKTMQIMIREDYSKGNFNHLQDIIAFRRSGWKFRDYAMRLAMNEKRKTAESYANVMIVWTVEKVSRNYKRLYEGMIADKVKKNKHILEYYDSMGTYIEYFAKHWHKADFDIIDEIHSKHDKLMEKAFETMNTLKSQQNLMLVLVENVRRIQDLCSILTMRKY